MAGTPTHLEAPARRWSFGPALLDEQRFELLVGGKTIRIERKPLEVLRHLLLHAGKLVTKDDLLKAIWPGRVLSETVITKCIARLREVLDDDDQAVIKTVHGYGYRLEAPVRIETPATADSASRTETVDLLPAAPPRPIEPERRQLTVLFCDLVDSTRLAQKLDAEGFREVLLGYQDAVAEIVRRYEGYIAQYLGDGVLIYFGYPAAHDDDAERAVRAGCDIMAAMARLNESGKTAKLATRIGVHTGAVVVGPVGSGDRQETLALGGATNLAARLQALAQPGTVVISADTQRLVPGLFIIKDLGATELKGIERPVRAYQVLQPSGVRTRLEAAERLTPFVGREQELALLRDRWRAAREGQGQAVLIVAEPGIGKSRLVLTLREHLADSAHTWLECRASPLTRNSAFQPVAELLHRGLAFRETDATATKLMRLEQGLDQVRLDKSEAVPLLAPLLNLAVPDRYRLSAYSPQLQHKRTIEYLVQWILQLSLPQPLAIVIEDLHWADPSTLELLKQLLEHAPSHKVFVLMTARPEFQPPWPLRPHTMILSLGPLRREETNRMLDSLTGHRALPETVRQEILRRTGGVPLFLEEVTRMLLESGQLVETEGSYALLNSIGDLVIPATLHDSLMARLDRLGPAKWIVQVCAVIGRDIPHKLLVAVGDTEEAELVAHLRALIDAQILYPRGMHPDGTTYLFKHALIQDTAYESLLKVARQKLHGKIAGALEKARAEPEVLAVHFEKAGLTHEAVRHYRQASKKAGLQGFSDEAIASANHALALLAGAPADHDRDHLELDVLIILGVCQADALGYSHADVERTFARAHDLSLRVNDPVLSARVLRSRANIHLSRAEYEKCLQLGETLIETGQKTAAGLSLAVGYATVGWSQFAFGQLRAAQESLEKAIAVGQRGISERSRQLLGREPMTGANVTLSLVFWLLGFPERAVRTAEAAEAQARDLGLPFSLALARSSAMPLTRLFRREPQAVRDTCQAFRSSFAHHEFSELHLAASRYLGLADCMLGQLESGLARVREAVAIQQSAETNTLLSMVVGMEAEQCVSAGRFSEAHAALGRAHALAEKHGERFWEAELHRLKGKLTLTDPTLPRNEADAETCFREALEISRGQQAKSLELRAATSLARLWRQQGRNREARAILQPVYEWFTEGFDTADLRDAKVLLDRLE